VTDHPTDLELGQAVTYQHGTATSGITVDLARGDRGIATAVDTTQPPPPPPSGNPSGFALPTTPKAGWKFAGRTDFDDEIPLWDGNPNHQGWKGDKQGVLIPRPDAARDGSYTDSSHRARYDAKRTISQEGGLLICRMFQAGAQRYAGSPRTALAAVPSLRVTQAMRVAAPVDGWKIAPLVSVEGGNVSKRGEYDMPEGKLTAQPYVNAFMHKVGGALVTKRISDVTGHRGEFYRWHTWTTEVVSGKSVQYELDGQVILRVTDGVTKEPVSWKLQHETYLAGQAIPASMGEARVLIDWVTVEIPA
jgi:hypothetical protein